MSSALSPQVCPATSCVSRLLRREHLATETTIRAIALLLGGWRSQRGFDAAGLSASVAGAAKELAAELWQSKGVAFVHVAEGWTDEGRNLLSVYFTRFRVAQFLFSFFLKKTSAVRTE